MNNSSSTGLLLKLNGEKAIVLIPAMAFVGIMMLTGFVGNVVVCYFYGCKTKRTPTSCFILGFAIFDLIICTISMPMAIVNLRFFYMFPYIIVCKVLRTIDFVCTISSGLILIAIAIERYRRICLPFRRQITVFQARFLCFVSFIISCALSWPGFMFYTVVTVDVSIPESGVFQKYHCTTVKDASLQIYLYVFIVIHILLFTSGVVVLTVLYVLVGRELIRRKRFRKYGPEDVTVYFKPSEFLISANSALRKSNKQSTNTNMYMTNETSIGAAEHTIFRESNSDSNEKCTGHVKLEQTNIPAQQGKECVSLEFSEIGENELPSYMSGTFNNENVSRASDMNRPKYEYSLNNKMAAGTNTVRYNTLIIVITVTFIVGFLPYLCLAVWRNLSLVYEINNMTDVQLIFYSIGIRSYFLNSALNPMIYGLFNSQFRHFFTSVFCARCLHKPNCK